MNKRVLISYILIIFQLHAVVLGRQFCYLKSNFGVETRLLLNALGKLLEKNVPAAKKKLARLIVKIQCML